MYEIVVTDGPGVMVRHEIGGVDALKRMHADVTRGLVAFMAFRPFNEAEVFHGSV